MLKSFFIQKTIALCTVALLASCTTNSKIWDRYDKLNNGTTPNSSRLHSKYFDMNDKTGSNFTYSSSQASLK